MRKIENRHLYDKYDFWGKDGENDFKRFLFSVHNPRLTFFEEFAMNI